MAENPVSPDRPQITHDSQSNRDSRVIVEKAEDRSKEQAGHQCYPQATKINAGMVLREIAQKISIPKILAIGE